MKQRIWIALKGYRPILKNIFILVALNLLFHYIWQRVTD